jgi:cobalt-zinc-cadmium efflux system membrane fusion protein
MIHRPPLLVLLALALMVSGCGHPAAPVEKSEKSEKPEAKEADEKAAGDRVHIEAAIAAQSGVRTAPVGPGVIRDEHEVQGLLLPIDGRNAHIMARFPGPVRAVRVAVGDRVTAGQTLAVIESNVSLSDYAVTAPLAGTVLSRNVAVGDLAGDKPLFEIADLSKLWVDIHLFGGDAEHLHAGLPVEVMRLSDNVRSSTTLDRVLPGMATASQSTVGRAIVINTDGNWRPGASVRVRVSVSQDAVARVVPLEAIQSLRGQEVVFVREGENYEARPVKLGRRDGHYAEVLDGVAIGDDVVVEQSYLIKADIEKSSVEDSD